MDSESELRIIDALIDNLWELTPEELEAELIEDGIDPEEYAREGLEIMLRGVQKHYARQRQELAEELTSSSRKRKRVSLELTLEELRAAIRAKLALLSPRQQRLTLCNRDLRELTPEDLRSTLEDLEELTADDDDLE